MKNLYAVFFLSIASLTVFNQTAGDEVRYQCFCFGQEWVKATIERVDGNNLRVRFGNMDNQVITLPKNSPKLRIGNAARNPLESVAPDQIQQAFMAESSRFAKAVEIFAPGYDVRFNGGGATPDSAIWTKSLADLAELDGLCRGRYRGLSDYRGPGYIREGSIDYRFGMWCDLAANRVAVEQKARVAVVKTLVNLGYTDENLAFGFNEPDNPLRMEVQDMIWNRAKWRAIKIAWLRPKYAVYKVAVPSDATAAAEKRADELWAIVERGAPNRSYKQPPWHDAAVESFVKNKLSAKFPGVQIIKIGLDYKTWVKRASESLVASDDYFNYYKVTYNSYKRGNVLIKMPGRPFCQMQDFVVGQSGKGLVDAGIGGSGTFMRCE